jgi:hypothetical protein
MKGTPRMGQMSALRSSSSGRRAPARDAGGGSRRSPADPAPLDGRHAARGGRAARRRARGRSRSSTGQARARRRDVGVSRERLDHEDCAPGFLLDGSRAPAAGRALARSSRGKTPLSCACSSTCPDEELVRRMLSRGRADDTPDVVRGALCATTSADRAAHGRGTAARASLRRSTARARRRRHARASRRGRAAMISIKTDEEFRAMREAGRSWPRSSRGRARTSSAG